MCANVAGGRGLSPAERALKALRVSLFFSEIVFVAVPPFLLVLFFAMLLRGRKPPQQPPLAGDGENCPGRRQRETWRYKVLTKQPLPAPDGIGKL